ncbi:MAG: hypothetical protein ACRD3D_05505 [Terriglobia bacterium]
MIKNVQAWQKWEDEFTGREPPDFQQNLKLLEAMYEYACRMGRFPRADPLEGLESRIRLARAFNARTPPGSDQP